jgi:hypothetical protein
MLPGLRLVESTELTLEKKTGEEPLDLMTPLAEAWGGRGGGGKTSFSLRPIVSKNRSRSVEDLDPRLRTSLVTGWGLDVVGPRGRCGGGCCGPPPPRSTWTSVKSPPPVRRWLLPDFLYRWLRSDFDRRMGRRAGSVTAEERNINIWKNMMRLFSYCFLKVSWRSCF